MALQAVRDRKVSILLIAEDASGNTREKITRAAERAGTPWAVCGTMESLGHAVGKAERAYLAVRDRGLAAGIYKLLQVQGCEIHGEIRAARTRMHKNV
jgi:ribosomal protein L7Ae-like RNA K-turn-binding protein